MQTADSAGISGRRYERVTGMRIKSDKKKNKSERHIIGPLIGLIMLALICYWQYITILDNDV